MAANINVVYGCRSINGINNKIYSSTEDFIFIELYNYVVIPNKVDSF